MPTLSGAIWSGIAVCAFDRPCRATAGHTVSIEYPAGQAPFASAAN
jgi:hypothetical protein